MTLLLTKKDEQLRHAFMRPEEKVPETWHSTFTTPTGFMVATSERKSGVNEAAGKSWSRFQDNRIEFFSMKGGVLNYYTKDRTIPRDDRGRRNGRSRMGTVRNNLPLFLRTYAYDIERFSEFYDIGAEHLGHKSIDDLLDAQFPLRADFRANIPGITTLMRHENLTAMSRALMGKHFQKGIPRALANAGGSRPRDMRTALLEIVMAFNGIVPTDWIVDILNSQDNRLPDTFFQTRDELRGLRRFLRTGTETQLRRLTRNPTSHFVMWMRDSAQRMDTLQGVDFRDLRELHDIHAPRIQRQKKVASVDIELPKKAQKLLGEGEGFSVIAPANTEELFAWSNTMGNCISGYGRKAAAQTSLLYAVMQDGQMVANIELDPDGTVRQLLGQYNQHVNPELSAAVKDRIHSVWPKANVAGGWQ